MKHFAITALAVLLAGSIISLEAWPAVLPLLIFGAMNCSWVRKRLMKDGK